MDNNQIIIYQAEDGSTQIDVHFLHVNSARFTQPPTPLLKSNLCNYCTSSTI